MKTWYFFYLYKTEIAAGGTGSAGKIISTQHNEMMPKTAFVHAMQGAAMLDYRSSYRVIHSSFDDYGGTVMDLETGVFYHEGSAYKTPEWCRNELQRAIVLARFVEKGEQPQ